MACCALAAMTALTVTGCVTAPKGTPLTLGSGPPRSSTPAIEETTAGQAITSVSAAISNVTGSTWTVAEKDRRGVTACSKADAAVPRSTRPSTSAVGTALETNQFDQVLDLVAQALATYGYTKQDIVARYPDVLDVVWRNQQGALIRLDSSEVLTLSGTTSCWPDAAYSESTKPKS